MRLTGNAHALIWVLALLMQALRIRLPKWEFSGPHQENRTIDIFECRISRISSFSRPSDYTLFCQPQRLTEKGVITGSRKRGCGALWESRD